MPIRIDMLANTRDAVRGVRDYGEALEGVADSLDDVARDARRSGNQVGDAFNAATRDTARDARRSADQIGDAYSDAGRDIARDARRSGDQVGDAYSDAARDGERSAERLERSFKEASDATAAGGTTGVTRFADTTRRSMAESSESVETFRDEAKSNLSEVASSFQGDWTSAVDLIQGTLGGIVADLGPLGLAAGAAGAVGVGIIGAAFQQSAEDAEEFRSRVEGMTQELVQEFTEQGDALSAIDTKLREWASDNEKYGVSLSDLRKEARTAKVDFGDLATVIAGGTTKELRAMKQQVEESEEAYRRQAATVDTTAGADRSAAKAAGEKAERLRSDVLPAIEQQIQANENAQAAEEALADAQGLTVAQYRQRVQEQQAADEASEAAKQAEEARLEERKAKLQEYAGVVKGVYTETAESESSAIDNGVMNASRYAAGLEQRIAAAQQFQTNLQAIGAQLPADIFDFVRDQGPGFSQEIATYLSATPEQQARIQAAWKISAQVTADTAPVDQATAEKGQERKDGPTLDVKGDTSDVDKKTAEKGTERKDGGTVTVKGDTSDVDKKVAALGGQTKKGPTLELRADASDLDSKVSAKGAERKKGPTLELRADASDVDKKVAEKGKQRSDGPTVRIRADDGDVGTALARLRDRVSTGPTVRFQVDDSSVNNTITRIRNTTINVKVKAVDG